MEVRFVHITPLVVVSQAIRECYDSHDKSDSYNYISYYGGTQQLSNAVIGPKDKELIHKVGNINKHQSVLEHLVFSIRISNVSRLLLQEFARHRIASLSVKSTRFTLQELKDEQSFTNGDNCLERAEKYIVIPERQYIEDEADYDWFLTSQLTQLELLRQAIASGMKRDVSKYLVPDSYKTNISWTINARSLQNFLKLRSAKNAHFEIRELANTIFNTMPEDYKYLFEDCMEQL